MSTQQTKEQLTNAAADSVLAYLQRIGCEKDGHLLEHTYNLTIFKASKHKEYGSMCYDYKHVCIELLSLLADPEISGKLPAHTQKEAGTCLKNMWRFFDGIADGATEAAIDLQAVEQYSYSMTEDEIKRIQIRYTHLLKHKNEIAA